MAALALRRFPAAATDGSWLARGGDDRILIDAATGMNKYGCAPAPDDSIWAFGSSTASTVSSPAFAAAERLREAIGPAPSAQVYRRELDRLRAEFRSLCGLEDLAGLDMVFGASGTDLHLIAALLTTSAGDAPLVVMVNSSETGSGVPAALSAHHFGACSALRASVEPGARVAGQTLETVAVATRDGEGAPRKDVDAQVESVVLGAMARGRTVLLTLTDVTKTGLLAPSPGCALRLQRAYPGQVRVLVDACQFRLAPATLRAYLESGFMVAMTGSKFLTGPTFSGLLLIPAMAAAGLRKRPLSPSLADYSHRADWPDDWPGVDCLPDTANGGLLLRWQAAMAELRAFCAISDAKKVSFFRSFQAAIQSRLELDPALDALPVTAPDRSALGLPPQWDAIPTIFPFRLRHGKNPGHLDALACRGVYQALLTESIQLGQPVQCGTQGAALRICASARLAVEAADSPAATIAVIRRALMVLDRAVDLARDLI